MGYLVMKKPRKIDSVSRETVKKYLDYFPDTGEFRWTKDSPNRCKTGGLAGSVNNNRKLVIGIDGVVCRASLLAFILMDKELPPFVKYIDGNSQNLRWSNLEYSEKKISAKHTSIKGSRAIPAIFDRCPILGGRIENTGVAKFNSLELFFRTCCAKQGDTRIWGTSKMDYKLVGKLHSKCRTCKQAKGSRSREVVINLGEIGVVIDESMGVLR